MSQDQGTPGGKILVVDDEPGIREYLSWELGSFGHEVVTAPCGADALALLSQQDFDLVISDVKMPGMSGIEVLRRAKGLAPDTEVIIATGHAELDQVVECVRAGAFDFFHKPLQTADLLPAIARALARRRERMGRPAAPPSPTLLAQENARLLRELVASDRLAKVGLHTAGIAHELNNPLASVMFNTTIGGGLVDDLAVGVRPLGEIISELRETFTDMGEGAERIRELARDLTGLARRDDQPEPVQLEETIHAALRITVGRVRSVAKVTLHLAGEQVVLGHPGRLAQVFINLLVNAAQAIEGMTARRPHEITITTRTSGEWVVATVSDDGPGIPPADLTRIFDTFFTTKPAASGTGLGLTLVRQIVESHGGRITAESTLGLGTRLTIRLPALALPVATGRVNGDRAHGDPEGADRR